MSRTTTLRRPALRRGLVSVTFRSLPVAEVVGVAAAAGLQGIEWGGDVHVPPGDRTVAEFAASCTRERGLEILAYGSYLRLGQTRPEERAAVLETAHILGAPTIRVWAGNKPSIEHSAAERSQIFSEALELADRAAELGMTISYEYHSHTLTDTARSAEQLFAETRHPAIETLWQPPNGVSDADCLDSLRGAMPFLRNVHVFHWWPTTRERHPLAVGRERWLKFLRCIQQAGRRPDFLLEFLPGDEVASLPPEAATLQEWIAEVWPAD